MQANYLTIFVLCWTVLWTNLHSWTTVISPVPSGDLYWLLLAMPSGDLYWLLLALHSVLTDETCFVPSERIYDCGPASSEAECEARGCCYNASAMVACYYPSGTVIGSILHVCRYWYMYVHIYVRTYVCTYVRMHYNYHIRTYAL